MRFLSRFTVAVLVAFLTSVLIASASYFLGLWLGVNRSNLRWIILASIPFALLVGVAAIARPGREGERQGSAIVAVLVGAGLGLFYSFFVARHAPGTVALFVLMLSCWVPSGISAMVASALSKQRGALITTAVLCVVAVVLPEPIFNAVTHNQRLTVAFIVPSELSTARLEAYPEAVGFGSDDEVSTAKSDVLEHMRALGYGEAFRVLSITRAGKGSKSLAVIVVQAPFTTKVTLPVPNGTVVVYVPGSGGWEKNPREARLLRRSISLMPAGGEDGSLGYFEIPNAQGISLEGRIGVEPLVEPR
jgi:hypothetical protein